MKSAVVADSTVLIGLERVGRLEILHSLFEPLYIPPEVRDEFGICVSWLTVAAYSDQALFQSLCTQVDVGEAAALTLAHDKNAPVIPDDRQARAAARKIGLTITGTIGFCFSPNMLESFRISYQ